MKGLARLEYPARVQNPHCMLFSFAFKFTQRGSTSKLFKICKTAYFLPKSPALIIFSLFSEQESNLGWNHLYSVIRPNLQLLNYLHIH